MPHSRIVYDARLERADEVAHRKRRALQVNERIDDELSRTVIGHLAAAIDLQNRNIPRRNEVRAARVHPEREDGRMLEKPDLIRALGTALGGEGLHRAPGGFVVDASEMADDGRRRPPPRRRLGLAEACGRQVHGACAAARLSRPALLRFSACSAR